MRLARIAVLGLAALGLGSTAASSKTLVYCSESAPESFTPALNTSSTSFDAARPALDRLIEFKPGTTDLRPGLAESWDISPDGTAITFHLRRGVKINATKGFKPTRDFDADDVIFSFGRQHDPANPYNKIGGGRFDYYNDMDLPKLVTTIDRLDDHTVLFRLSEPNVTILADLAMDFAAIQSKEFADAMLKAGTPEQFDQVPVGTGPFAFSSYQKDAIIRFKANPDYWGGRPKLDDLVFAITPDPTARSAKLKSGECQVAPFPRPADLADMRADPDLVVQSQPGLNIGYLAFNVTKAPLDKKQVRVALSMAIDRGAILKDVYLGAGQPARNLIPPTLWAYNDAVADYPYDPAAATAMLAAAGIRPPLDIDLWYMPVQRPYNPDGKRIGEMMQADLAKVGVNARLVSYEFGEYRKRVKAGEDMTAEFGWTGDNGDPDNFFFLLGCHGGKPGASNAAKWCDPTYDADLAKARTLTDQGARKRIYDEMQVMLHDAAPMLLIAHSTVFMAMRRTVDGYIMSPLGTHDFARVDLK